jgi:putative heme-binding domain-containing protein
MCHGLPGDGGDVGPDLQGVGLRHDRAGLITAVLDPSAALAPGYGTVALLTTDGREVEGAFEKETADAIHLKDDQGVHRQVPKGAIKELQRRSPMPVGLYQQFSPQEFADLVSFLESLR